MSRKQSWSEQTRDGEYNNAQTDKQASKILQINKQANSWNKGINKQQHQTYLQPG